MCAQLSIGMASFYDWYALPSACAQLERQLPAFLRSSGHVVGLELMLSFEGLAEWVTRLKVCRDSLPSMLCISSDHAAQVLQLPRNTVHIPDLKNIRPEQVPQLCEQLYSLYQYTGIAEVTSHPDEVPPTFLTELLRYWPKEVCLSLENLDPFKKNCQRLEELAELLDCAPQLRMTFDLCHWMDCHSQIPGVALDSLTNYRDLFQKRLSKMHLSTPIRNSLYQDFPDLVTRHYLLSGSAFALPSGLFSLLKGETLCVIEGVIPLGKFELLLQEVDYLTQQTDMPPPP